MPRALPFNRYAQRKALHERRRLEVAFPTVRLSIELVPMSCWGKNLRSRLRPVLWEQIREQTLASSCSCHACGSGRQLGKRECHEVWTYHDEILVQRLSDIVALCPSCHHVKHFGLSGILNIQAPAERRLRRINGWSASQLDEYLDLSFSVWNYSSHNSWNQDLNWITVHGFPYQARPRLPRVRVRQ